MVATSPFSGMTQVECITAFRSLAIHTSGVMPKATQLGFIDGAPQLHHGLASTRVKLPEPLLELPHTVHSPQISRWMRGAFHVRVHAPTDPRHPATAPYARVANGAPARGFLEELAGMQQRIDSYSSVLRGQNPSTSEIRLQARRLREKGGGATFRRGTELLTAGALLAYVAHKIPNIPNKPKTHMKAEGAFSLAGDTFLQSENHVAAAVSFELAMQELLSPFGDFNHPEEEVDLRVNRKLRMLDHAMNAANAYLLSLRSDRDEESYDMRLYRGLLYAAQLYPTLYEHEQELRMLLLGRQVDAERFHDAGDTAIRAAMRMIEGTSGYKQAWAATSGFIELAMKHWQRAGVHSEALAEADRFLQDAKFWGMRI